MTLFVVQVSQPYLPSGNFQHYAAWMPFFAVSLSLIWYLVTFNPAALCSHRRLRYITVPDLSTSEGREHPSSAVANKYTQLHNVVETAEAVGVICMCFPGSGRHNQQCIHMYMMLHIRCATSLKHTSPTGKPPRNANRITVNAEGGNPWDIRPCC